MFHFRPPFQLQRPTTRPTRNITPNGPPSRTPQKPYPQPQPKSQGRKQQKQRPHPHPPWNPKGHTPDHPLPPNATDIRHNVPHKPTHISTSHPKHPQSHPRKQLKRIQLPGRPQYRLIKCFFRVLRKLSTDGLLLIYLGILFQKEAPA